jgi:hypothetical protein
VAGRGGWGINLFFVGLSAHIHLVPYHLAIQQPGELHYSQESGRQSHNYSKKREVLSSQQKGEIPKNAKIEATQQIVIYQLFYGETI